MGVMAFDALELVAALQHAVEFVDQHGNGFVAFLRLDDRVHVGPLNFDMAFGLELGADRLVAVAFQFHAKSHDALLMTKQSLGFFADESLERRGQLKVDARDDYFVGILAIHVSALGFG